MSEVKTCPTCHGERVLYDAPTGRKCPSCKGTGVVWRDTDVEEWLPGNTAPNSPLDLTYDGENR